MGTPYIWVGPLFRSKWSFKAVDILAGRRRPPSENHGRRMTIAQTVPSRQNPTSLNRPSHTCSFIGFSNTANLLFEKHVVSCTPVLSTTFWLRLYWPPVPILICINKVDLATREHLDKALEETRKIFEKDEILEISSKTGTNLQTLQQKISEKLTTAIPVSC